MNQTKTKWIFIAIMLFSVSFIVAQSTISGSVKDASGQPLVGVNVILEDTSKGSQTDFDGNYTISNVENGTYQ